MLIMNIIRFLKDWTLPVSITMGTLCYLTFYYVPQLDALGDSLAVRLPDAVCHLL